MDYLAPYVKNRFVQENSFRKLALTQIPLQAYEEVQALLPKPFWKNHYSSIACYWKAWQLAFQNLHQPSEKNGFVTPFIDTVFEDEYSSRSLYMWDTVFVSLFARYGVQVSNLHHMLNNFYAKQHEDGYICRQIRQIDGSDAWHRFDHNGTGSNIFAWGEWLHYQHLGDQTRLSQVFPALVAYHQWLRAHRTWRDGSYWSTGLSCGMDNQPRFNGEFYYGWQHDHLVWVDTCLQQVLSARSILKIANVLDQLEEVKDLQKESEHLTSFINQHLWDEQDGFYYDLRQDNQFVRVKSIGAYWSLLADVMSPEQRSSLITHLENTEEFNRPHRIPALSADHVDYRPSGDYWRGGVWSPTNYMVIAGLRQQQFYRLAHEIACNHVENVASIFENSGTLWENYAPETLVPGTPSLPDLVGWTGLSAISVLLEDVFGISYTHNPTRLVWRVHLLDAHGVERYPLDHKNHVTLLCGGRESADVQPTITIESTQPLEVEIRWGNDAQHQMLIHAPASKPYHSQ